LDRCLDALSRQDLRPTRVLVVRRADDTASSEIVEKWLPTLQVEETCVSAPGQVHALNTGLDWIRGQSSEARSKIDLVCILDDDTAPHAGWLHRIASIFATEPDVGGVGGRDYNFIDGKPLMDEASPVGTILWYGRLIGNHHLGSGPRRDVHFLKGANMTYRMAAIGDLRFDHRLLGSGAQVHNDLAFSMGVRNRGWRLVYDPQVSVDHFSAERFDSDRRGAPAMDAIENMGANFYLTLRCYVAPPHRRAIALFYNWSVGRRKVPGLLLGLWFRLRSNEDGVALRAVCARAWKTARKLAR
jgi:glycosyltransferase involved in cell wall biosynthesis